MKLLNHQIIFKKAVSVDNTLMIRNNQSFLNKIQNFIIFCDNLKWSTVCIIEIKQLLNKTAALTVFNFNKNNINFFNFFIAIANFYTFVFNKNHSNLKFKIYLLLYFFYMFSSLYIVYFHEYIHHSSSHFFHQKLFRFLSFSLYK